MSIIKYMSESGLRYFWGKVKAGLDNKVDKADGKMLTTNDFTDELLTKLDGIEEGANKYSHPTSGVTAGTYRSLTVDDNGHVTAGENPTTLAGYGITDAAAKEHTHSSDDITSVDASKITGMLDLSVIPPAAIERCVIVSTDEDRFSLTTNDVQVGDTVKVEGTEQLYYVVDDENLGNEEGYVAYTASKAAAVDWSGVLEKPTTIAGYGITDAAPLSHSSDDTTYGAASETSYGHAKASSTTPLVAGVANVGSETDSFARGDHVHPEQVNITGNAGTASKLENSVTINGVEFDGSVDISLTPEDLGFEELTTAEIDEIMV